MKHQAKTLPIVDPDFDVEAWQSDLNGGLSELRGLVPLDHTNETDLKGLEAVGERFKFRVSRYYLSLIDWTDPECPIRRQAIPDQRELNVTALEMTDPTGDDRFRATPLIIHRYPDRVLLTPTLNCPMYCRYCFRKVGLNDQAP